MELGLPLVTAQWLAKNSDNPKLIIIDASLKSPITAKSSEERKLIPRSLKFDWDQFSDSTTELPHMMPNEDDFTVAAQTLGINNDSLLVVYDAIGIYSSPRVWWMFKAMGFTNCYVLNGGLPAWLAKGYDVDDQHAQPIGTGNFKANDDSRSFCNSSAVLKAIDDKDICIIDARSEERFYGRISEPRVGLNRGHIPNSINIPFEQVLLQHEMKSKEELKQVFENISKDSQLIFSCGSGVTACIDALAATLIGYQHISIYDGSWSEWGMDIKNPARENQAGLT
jgi:thiosulfate/3-mercaptopyruvate sulfurtransferase